MLNDYLEDKPGLISAINIVPLIGVFAALLVVTMLEFPGVTTRHVNDFSRWCGPNDGPHEHRLKIHLDASGHATLDKSGITNDQLVDAIATVPKLGKHEIIALVDIDSDARYQDVMSLISALRSCGLKDKNIRIIATR